MALMMRLKERNAQTIFGAIGDELSKDGVTLIEPLPWLRPWMPGRGYACGAKLTSAQLDDVRYGYRLALETSRLEIGQSIVVKAGTVLAVEAFEGTDACLARGGKLAGRDGQAIAVKVAKKNHDMRFDIPCIGPKTVQVCSESGISALAFDPEKTLLLEKDELEQSARQLKIGIIACET